MSIVNKSGEKNKGSNTKYIHFFLIAAAFLGFMYFSAPSESDISVYLFSGRDDFVMLNNGIIIVTDRSDRFLGGDLIFREGVISDVTEVSVQFFFSDRYGGRFPIYTHYFDHRGVGSDVYFLPMGEFPIDHGGLRDNIESIVYSFHCEITITFSDGTTHESTLFLEVREVL